jgi:hypothetical protein
MSQLAPSRDFDLGDILSISDGRLVSPRHMDGVYDIVNYMTGDSISTIGLLAAAPVCRRALLEQHPALAVVSEDHTELTPANFLDWLNGWKAKLGATLPVTPLMSWEPRTIADDILDVTRINPKADIMVLEP